MKRWHKIMIALGVLLVLAGGYVWLRHPSLLRYELKIATGPMGSEGQKTLAAFLRELAAERPIIRLVPVPTETLAESGKALMEGKVDLAVVRSDDPAAAQGRTLFLLRRIGIAVLLPPDSKIESVAELAGKKLAVTKAAQFDPALLKAFTSFYGLNEADLVELAPAQLGPALKARRVVAALAFGPLGPGPIGDAFAAVRKSFKEKPTFLDIAESEAIVARSPAFEAIEIKQGGLGGTPPEPPEAINSFAVSVRLVSRASLPDRVAGEITRLLLSTKAKLAATTPVVGQMEAPDTEKSALLPVHPGTLAYLGGEQVSLLDETLNYYWLSAMIFAVVAPLVGWFASRRTEGKRDEARARLLRLVEFVRLSKTGTAAELEGADAELQEMTEWLFEQLAAGDIERDHFQCIDRVIEQLRGAIDKRLAELGTPSGKIASAA